MFQNWQHQKRSNSARLPHVSKLKTSKTKEFCETSFKNGKLSAELAASCQCLLRFFHSTCLKYCACHEKVMPGHTKCSTCHTKSSSQNWRSDAPKCTLRKWAPGPPNMSLVLRLPRKMHLCRDLNVKKWSEPLVLLTFWLRNVLRATTACTFSTSQLPKMVRACCALYILTSKCASRHNGVHFFDISTSKSGPSMVCFVHFDFEMCFAPQRRALFRHLNFQKMIRACCALYILTSKCASRHNGVHFFDISTSKSSPSMVCFVHFDLDMCFAPQWCAIFHLSSGQLAPHPPL